MNFYHLNLEDFLKILKSYIQVLDNILKQKK